jgi:NAD(P)-dependent dehydrogenase (short-subunit alcohol dehydrogenase family)
MFEGQHLTRNSNAQFIQCDVTDWDQLVQAFEAATQNSPNKVLDVVIANAGIVGLDEMFTLEGQYPFFRRVLTVSLRSSYHNLIPTH